MRGKILVYGCSVYAINILENLDIDYDMLDFTDSDDKKKVVSLRRKPEGGSLDKRIIPSAMVKVDDYAFCVIGSKNYENEIREICKQKGFLESRIISVNYIIGHWRRWEKSKIYNSWKKSIENENVEVIRNWHASGRDMQCVLCIRNAAFCQIEMEFLKLFNHKKKVEVWNVCEENQMTDCLTGEQIKWKMNMNEVLLRIVVKNSLDEIPWCTVDVLKSDGRNAIETIKRGETFLNTYKSLSSFYYYDEDYLALQRIKNKGTILDVGAQYGQSMYAFYWLTESKIISIEVVPELYEVLDAFRKNFDMKNRVKVINAGISDQSGELIWYEPADPKIAGSFDKEFIYNRKLGVSITEKRLSCNRLDDIVGDIDDIWFMKMDVEGLEYKAICGCMETIKKNYPIILIEQNEKTKEILAYLKDYYEMFYYNVTTDGFEKSRISALNCWLIPRKKYRNNIVKEFVKNRGIE